MNTTTHSVTKILSEPYFNYLWCVDVEANSWGCVKKTTVHFKTEEEAKMLAVGYEFEA